MNSKIELNALKMLKKIFGRKLSIKYHSKHKKRFCLVQSKIKLKY